MRVGLIGYGAWGRFHARSLAEVAGAELAAILAHGDASAASAAADWPDVPVHRDLDRFLATSMEAVDIVAPNHLHAALAVAALRSGRHVLLEKPLATTAEDCDRILAAARAAGRQVSVNHELRCSPQWGGIRQEIEAGSIGTPQAGSYALFRRPFRPGAGGWRVDPARVGSWVLEEPVHFFDLMLWYFAAHGDPVAVRAIAAGTDRLAHSLAATVRYASGAWFTVNQTVAGFEHHCSLDIAGDAGAVRALWSGGDARVQDGTASLSILRRGAERPEAVAFARTGEVYEQTEHLRRSLAAFARGESWVPAEAGRKSVLVCLAVEEACRSGQEVPLRF